MYRDSYSPRPESGLIRFLRALSASFPLGRFFGVHVRVYWLALVLLPLIEFAERSKWDPSASNGVADALMTTLLLFFVIWTHEMGHIVAGRRFGIPTHLITLSPMGGIAHMEAIPGTPKKEVIVSLAGPATHLLWLALVAGPLFLIDHGGPGRDSWMLEPLGRPFLFTLGLLWWVNVVLMVFNLLPFFPMDGGRCLRAFLSMRMSPWRATVFACRIGQVAAVGFVFIGLFREGLWGTIFFLIGISNFLACWRELKMLKYVPNPYDTPEADVPDPWAQDPDAWKQGGASAEAPGKRQRRAEEKAAERAEKARADAEALEREMDRVLERIGEVGMSGLTAKERKILERASEARRQGK